MKINFTPISLDIALQKFNKLILMSLNQLPTSHLLLLTAKIPHQIDIIQLEQTLSCNSLDKLYISHVSA